MSAGSRASGSDDEPLVPEDFDDDFYANVMDKITKALRQKDTHENADNVQRLVICSNRYKSDWQMEQLHCQELSNEIERLKDRLDHVNKLSKMDLATIAELRTVIQSAWMQKDAAQSREQLAQDEMLKMREKMDSLEQMVEHLSDKRSGLQRGVLHHEFLPQGRPVNKEYYPPDWLLHQDNAPAHTSLLVRDFSAKNNTLMMPQPPYSPDLAPVTFSCSRN